MRKKEEREYHLTAQQRDSQYITTAGTLMIIDEINDRCNTAFKTYQMIVYMKWVYIKDTTKNEIISPKNSKSEQV